MTTVIPRTEIRNLLIQWQLGSKTAQQVFDWANDRYCTEEFEAEDRIATEVLAQLDTLDMNLVTPEDIPHLLALLDIPSGNMEMYSLLDAAYSASINIKARQIALAADPLYAPFCR